MTRPEDHMVIILVLSVVIVIGGTAAATRLSSVQVRRRRKVIEVLTATISERRVAPFPVRRPRLSVAVSRLRPTSTLANVAVLADYRKARAARTRHQRVSAGGLPRSPRPRRPEPA
jgi:hypothetical protein